MSLWMQAHVLLAHCALQRLRSPRGHLLRFRSSFEGPARPGPARPLGPILQRRTLDGRPHRHALRLDFSPAELDGHCRGSARRRRCSGRPSTRLPISLEFASLSPAARIRCETDRPSPAAGQRVGDGTCSTHLAPRLRQRAPEARPRQPPARCYHSLPSSRVSTNAP